MLLCLNTTANTGMKVSSHRKKRSKPSERAKEHCIASLRFTSWEAGSQVLSGTHLLRYLKSLRLARLSRPKLYKDKDQQRTRKLSCSLSHFAVVDRSLIIEYMFSK
jgi:hypothetical protein